jgi:hypothetical protein
MKAAIGTGDGDRPRHIEHRSRIEQKLRAVPYAH